MSPSQVNITRLHELYAERSQIGAYGSTHSADIYQALTPVENEIRSLEDVTRAMISGMLKDGYSVSQVGDQLVYAGLDQHEADALIEGVRESFKRLFA